MYSPPVGVTTTSVISSRWAMSPPMPPEETEMSSMPTHSSEPEALLVRMRTCTSL